MKFAHTCVSYRILATFILLLGFLSGRAGQADEAFYIGKWKIVSATVAPWVEAGVTPNDSEMKSLIGKTITLKAHSVAGPGGFPCQKPQYEILEGGPDMLFQGAFGEMNSKDPKVDPQALADQVGLPGKSYRTVVTGCEYEVDFSFPAGDDNLAAFGLNDYVYLMQRE